MSYERECARKEKAQTQKIIFLKCFTQDKQSKTSLMGNKTQARRVEENGMLFIYNPLARYNESSSLSLNKIY
jgi:hypothetical protein